MKALQQLNNYDEGASGNEECNANTCAQYFNTNNEGNFFPKILKMRDENILHGNTYVFKILCKIRYTQNKVAGKLD